MAFSDSRDRYSGSYKRGGRCLLRIFLSVLCGSISVFILAIVMPSVFFPLGYYGILLGTFAGFLVLVVLELPTFARPEIMRPGRYVYLVFFAFAGMLGAGAKVIWSVTMRWLDGSDANVLIDGIQVTKGGLPTIAGWISNLHFVLLTGFVSLMIGIWYKFFIRWNILPFYCEERED